MFRPNLTCLISSSSGTDVYGRAMPGVAVTELCAVVNLNIVSNKSSVRADSSASRGSAMEFESNSIILLTVRTKARIDDVIEIDGFKLRIIGMAPCHDVAGKLDHYRAEAQMWSKN